MKRTLLLAALLAGSAAASAQSVYRCTVGGRSVFQDRPCEGATSEKLDVRAPGGQASASNPAQGAAMAQPPAAPDSGSRTAALQQYNQQVADDRKRRELTRTLVRLEFEREALQSGMDLELARLKAEQQRANNNLAGATYLQSINTEMQAVSSSYTLRLGSKDREIDSARAQIEALSIDR